MQTDAPASPPVTDATGTSPDATRPAGADGSQTFRALCRVVLDALFYPADGYEQDWQILPREWQGAVNYLAHQGLVQQHRHADGRLWTRILAEGVDRLRGRRR
jgi:hypothetical protein